MTTKDYFFSGKNYIRVTRGDTGPGSVDPGYPRLISDVWGWPKPFSDGIDAALYSGSKCYFFKGPQYIRVSRGVTGPGTVDPGYPRRISDDWGWPKGFGANGIDAALWSGPVCYFFKGTEYIRVTRGDSDTGSVDPGFPKKISDWEFPKGFGQNGIKGALYSGSVCYFFDGNRYIRVNRGPVGAGFVDAGYPRLIADVWGWKHGFGAKGIDAALYSGGALVPQPPATGGENNYYLQDGGNVLLGVSATMIFDEDFTSTSNGFSIQLNCYSQNLKNILSTWQQYVIYLQAGQTQLWARIDNWEGTDASPTEFLRVDQALAVLPTANTVNRGYSFQFILLNDTNGNVTGATYIVKDNTGKTIGNQTISIVGQTSRQGTKVTSAYLAPIVAFSFNIGGEYGGQTASLTTGTAGTITYTSKNPLTSVNVEPSFTVFNDPNWAETGENANVTWGSLPTTGHATITQGFAASPTVKAAVELGVQKKPARTILPPPDTARIKTQRGN